MSSTMDSGVNARACPICASTPVPYRFGIGPRNELPLLHCPSCRLIFVAAVDSDRARHDSTYHSAHEHVEDGVAAALNATGILAYWSRKLGWRAGTSILDLGCAEGRLVDVGRAMGFQMTGIDVSDYYVDRWRAHSLPCSVATAEEFRDRNPGVLFDAIVTRQVIEHVRDPLSFLSASRDLLRPGGNALVETGDPHRWQSRVQGKRWTNWIPREGIGAHVTFIGSETADVLGQRAGMPLAESVTIFRYRSLTSHAREQKTSATHPLTVAKYFFHRSRFSAGWCHRFVRS